MRTHNGMRPQDIPVLLKIVAKGKEAWQNKDLASELYISASEISESLNRSLIAGLINTEKRKIHKLSLLEFIKFGLHYVFPAVPGGIANGLPTAHSHIFMKQFFSSDIFYVWPDLTGKERGQMIQPLYKDVVKAASHDSEFYKMMALLDVIRVGKTREVKVAIDELKRIFEA